MTLVMFTVTHMPESIYQNVKETCTLALLAEKVLT